MTLKFMEGFENYTDGDCIKRKWALFSSIATFPTGRLQGISIRTSGSSQSTYRTRSLGLQNTWTVGFGLRYITSAVNDETLTFPLIVKRGVTEQIRFQWKKGTGNTFKFDVYRGATLLGSTSDFVSQSWHYFEFEFTLDTVNGAIEVRHNTVVDLSLPGPIDTADSGLAGADVMEMTFEKTGAHEVDDIYILDDQGSLNNSFLGDSVVEGRVPTSDSTPLDWSLDNGVGSFTNHYEALDSKSCTGSFNNQFIFSATVSDQDLLAFNSLSFITGQIHGIQVNSDARLDTTGTREFKHIIFSNATLYTSPTGGISHSVGSTSFQTFYDVFEVDPDTSAKWTLSAANAAEFGVEVVS